MDAPEATSFTAFEGYRRLAAGSLCEVTLAVKAAEEQGVSEPLLVFEDVSGRVADVDTRGSAEDIMARFATPSVATTKPAQPRGRGRPKLGVVAGEVTLLPRHWDWLRSQPGGASASLRRLVEAARKSDPVEPKQAREAAYHFMMALAGDLPDYEEAIRALFAGDRVRFSAVIADWPGDVRDHCRKMTAAAFPSEAA